MHSEIMQKKNAINHPDLDKFSRATFWDTDIVKIDWSRHANFVIERVFGYGTSEEQDCILSFYGQVRIQHFADTFVPSPFNHNVAINIQKALGHVAL